MEENNKYVYRVVVTVDELSLMAGHNVPRMLTRMYIADNECVVAIAEECMKRGEKIIGINLQEECVVRIVE